MPSIMWWRESRTRCEPGFVSGRSGRCPRRASRRSTRGADGAAAVCGRAGDGVGLLTKLVTAPLAPVRGVLWLTQQIAEAAERELYDEDAVRRRLDELQEAHEAGEIGDREFADAEEALLTRLTEARR